MRQGRLQGPHGTLDPAFRERVYSHPETLWRLSLVAGFGEASRLSSILRWRTIAKTPQTTGRLQLLAQHIGYDGPLFIESDEQ